MTLPSIPRNMCQLARPAIISMTIISSYHIISYHNISYHIIPYHQIIKSSNHHNDHQEHVGASWRDQPTPARQVHRPRLSSRRTSQVLPSIKIRKKKMKMMIHSLVILKQDELLYCGKSETRFWSH